MSRYLVTINGPRSRSEALAIVGKAPVGARVEVKAAKRTLPQNDKMWATLTDIALQVPVEGKKHTPDDWKKVFLDALRAELDAEEETMPSIDGLRRVPVGNSSSDLSVEEMSLMIELMLKFGAEHDVTFGDEARAA